MFMVVSRHKFSEQRGDSWMFNSRENAEFWLSQNNKSSLYDYYVVEVLSIY